MSVGDRSAIVGRMVPPAVADAIDPARVRRALVIKLRHHGDVLLSSPVFTVLKRAAPHAEIDALVYLETAPMLAAASGDLDRPHDRPRPEVARTAGAARGDGRLWRALRARRYDLVVHLTEHPRGAWLAADRSARASASRPSASAPAGSGARASRTGSCCRNRRRAIPSRPTSTRCAGSASGPTTTTSGSSTFRAPTPRRA